MAHSHSIQESHPWRADPLRFAEKRDAARRIVVNEPLEARLERAMVYGYQVGNPASAVST